MKIWRYLTLEKFELMLKHQALFFARADQFKEDPFEGSYPKKDVQKIDRIYADPKMFKSWRRFVAVNCWHKNEFESDGMWQLYSDRNKGIAIQSTVDRLKACCADHAYVTDVTYIDYQQDSLPDDLLVRPFEYKRRFFDHEREVRAIMWTLPPAKFIKNGFPEPGSPNSRSKIRAPGINVDVDLEELIESIVLSPKSTKRQIRKVEELLDKYKVRSVSPTKSELSDDPVW